MVKCGSSGLQPEHLKGVSRGEISGFTRASAARLRSLLFGLDYSAGQCFGMALTAPPWSPVGPEDAFGLVKRNLARCPSLVGLVWRKEVTKKGVPHYHLAVWSTCWPETFVWLAQNWARALVPKGASICPFRVRLSGSRITLPSPCNPFAVADLGRSSIERVTLSPRNQRLLNSSAALQYLCDHTSKHKAYQALTTGRAWGVCGSPPRLELGPGLDLDTLSRHDLAVVHRALSRMSRYWWADTSAPFGYRWSRPRNFASLGTHVLFRPGAVSALRRLVRLP